MGEYGLISAFCRGPLAALMNFARDERGSVTIESVLWLPIFFAFLGLAVDGAALFMNRALILRAVQDANRCFAIGNPECQSEADTEDVIRDKIQGVCRGNSCEDTDVDTTVSGTGIISTRVEIPASEIDVVGLFGLLRGFRVGVEAQYMRETS
jgi:Flp pilus assembly protein TadG